MKPEYYLIECELKVKKVFLYDIQYISYEYYKTIFYTNNKKFVSLQSLNKIQEHLSDKFLRINRNIIVNIDFIKEFIKKDRIIVMFNNAELIVSYRNVRKLINALRFHAVNA